VKRSKLEVGSGKLEAQSEKFKKNLEKKVTTQNPKV
jgi:hypothetical protein